MSKIVVIDPCCPETNRGSFCYLPYIFVSALRNEGHQVFFYEDFSISEIDILEGADKVYIALWGYPQIDACLLLNKLLKVDGFFGYYPLIDFLGLTKITLTPEMILNGIASYPKNYRSFETLLLSDCDMHLSKYSGKVYPFFTSYGCKMNCSFCPTTTNCERTRLCLTDKEMEICLSSLKDQDVKNVHLCDEDFLFDIERAGSILSLFNKYQINLIALTSPHSLSKFVVRFGKAFLEDSGIRLLEVGLETADPGERKGMKGSTASLCESLAESISTPILWLTMSLFPGDTVSAQKNTGQFLEKYGLKWEELLPRIRTNGTAGGLGQFFQLYHGTRGYDNAVQNGKVISRRPMRLIPSYIPNSLLHQRVVQKRIIRAEEIKWFDLYKVSPIVLTGEITLFELVAKETASYSSTANIAVSFALSGRLGLYEAV